MLEKTTRRLVLRGLGAWLAAGAARANAPVTSLRPHMRGDTAAAEPIADAVSRAERMLDEAGFSGDISWAVADIKTGLRLESVHGDTPLPPASVAKALTALYALESLGPDYRFRTRLLRNGPVTNGILDGDLILAGGGDPSLDTDGLAILAGKLKESGIREVRGDFIVSDGALPYVRSIDDEQPDQLGYSPAVSGIALNFNRVHFEWKPAKNGWAVAMDARTERYRPDVQMATMRVVNRKLPVYTYEDRDGIDTWTVASGALGKGGSRWLPVRDPAAYAGDVFRTLARSNGVVLKPAKVSHDVPAGDLVAEQRSLPLTTILRGMLKYSNNMTAEMVGMTASAERCGRPPSSLQASSLQMSRWAARRYGMKNTHMVDHSGLGDDSQMTADDLVGALVAVSRVGDLRSLLKPIPLRDTKGREVRGHPIKVNAKTGTLHFVSGLGGFMTAGDGTELAFAIFTADPAARARMVDRERPEGARGWNGRAKHFQQVLIERWGSLYLS